MLKNILEPQRKSIETKLRQILNSDLPQVIPFLNAIGLSKSNEILSKETLLSLNYDEISSIWYWFGVWDPVLHLIERITINSWLKQLIFKNIFSKILFIQKRYKNKYEMIQSFDKMYNIITWFTRHLLIAKFIFKMNITNIKSLINTQFLSTFYYRFFGYFSSVWFELLFHIDINAPTLPLFLDNLENDKTTVEIIQKCAHLSDYIYGPQDFLTKFIRQLRWMILPKSMSNTLKQYSYSKYNQFVKKKLNKHGFELKVINIKDSHSENFENKQQSNNNNNNNNDDIDKEYKGSSVLSYMFVIEKSTNNLFIVFRGTELITDFYHDMFFSDVQSTYSNISVHAGYYAALFGSGSSNILSIEQEINKILLSHPTITQIYFTGHSMGGALACLCGIELLARGQLIRTPWYDDKKSIYHDNNHYNNNAQSSSSSSSSSLSEDKNSKNIQRLFQEYMKLSNNDSTFYDKSELNKIDVQFITFGCPCFISSLTENKSLQRLQPSHDVYKSSYFHNNSIHIVHEYDPIPILSFGTYGILKRHFLTWFTKGHLNRYFQPLMITLGSVITERSLNLEKRISEWLGFNDNNNNVLFGRFLMCIAIHQVIRNKILVRMTKSIYNHINYSSFNELDKINKSLYKTIGMKYLNLSINSLLYPIIFYLMDGGFLDYGIWRSLSLRVIATRFCVSAVSSIWNNITLIVRDLYDEATYFPIPSKSGKYMILIPEDDVLYGTYLQTIQTRTGHSFFKTMQRPIQPYTWFTLHTQHNYCKNIDRITTLDDYKYDDDNDIEINNKEVRRRSNRTNSNNSSQQKSRRSSIQMQQQIIAEISMIPSPSNNDNYI